MKFNPPAPFGGRWWIVAGVRQDLCLLSGTNIAKLATVKVLFLFEECHVGNSRKCKEPYKVFRVLLNLHRGLNYVEDSCLD
jgi:hypothetical protein